MPVIKSVVDREFLIVANKVCRDRTISEGALGVLIHCLSYSKEFDASRAELMAIFGFGKGKLDGYTGELKAAGYLTIEPAPLKNGKFAGYVWTFYNVKQQVFTDTRKTGIRENRNPENPESFKEKKRKFKKTNHKDLKKENSDAPNRNGGAEKADANDAPETQKPETKTRRAAAREIIAYLCFGFPPDKLKHLQSKQETRIQSAIREIEILSDNKVFPALNFFGSFWANDWRSFDKKFDKFQRPRPEQFAELWFEFIESDALTKKQAAQTENTATAAPDYSDFNNMEF